MKIVNLEEFREYPEGTLYRKYGECLMELSVKGETWEVDFLEFEPFTDLEEDGNSEQRYDTLEKMSGDSSLSVPVDLPCYGRDGLFEKDMKFLIVEKEDYNKFIDYIKETGAYE